MAQNITYTPWEGTKCPWLCLRTTLLLFSVLWLFSFVSAFLTSLIKLILWLKLSTDKRQAEDMVGEGQWGPAPFHLNSGALELSAMDSRRGDGMNRGTEKGQQMLSNQDSSCCGIRSCETHFGGHSRQWSSLLCQRVQGESVPNKDPDVSERPSFTPASTWLVRC